MRAKGYHHAMPRAGIVSAVLLASVVAVRPAAAAPGQSPSGDAAPTQTAGDASTAASGPALLNLNVKWVLPVSAAGGALSELLGHHFSPESCSWCSVDRFDESVRPHLVWERHAGVADKLSWVTGFVVPPLLPLIAGRPLDRERLGQDFALMAEAWAVDDGINQVVKRIAARQRPFAHFDPAVTSKDANASFFSGHTSGSFALVFALYQAHRLRHDRDAGRLLAIGLPLAAATGYLRIAADKHWATDVGAAAAAGSLLGFLVPELHKRNQSIAVRPVASPTSVAVFVNLTP